MINEVTKSFQDSVKERVTSPLLGSFILFLLAFNYKVIFIFFSSGTVAEKLSYLPEIGLFYPLIATVIFVSIYPLISNLVYEYWDYLREKRREKQRESLKSEINTMKQEELDHFNRQLLEDEFHFNEILTGKNHLIDAQSNEIAELKAKVTELEKIAGEIYPGFEYDGNSGLPYKSVERGRNVFFCPNCLAERKAVPLLTDDKHCPVCDKNYF